MVIRENPYAFEDRRERAGAANLKSMSLQSRYRNFKFKAATGNQYLLELL
jgi:hypothetical protein